ncbi:MAG TPA: bifunctional folylpolyglutamate synthase/dihydrofolate synthase [Firmicutes bacterium]|nr:bifunctional folylpolyglutamate synthase/dihydrofolate synthase [Bacillota bacterium]
MKIIGVRQRFGSHLGLERIALVCEELGNPQDQLKVIHIAGTSGKGSVAAMLAGVLQKAGLKVGLFTSPHLEHYRERFQINGNYIDDAALKKFADLAEAAIQRVETANRDLGPVTEFELATAIAFLYFLHSKVDIVVLETGLGGRLDSTNVVRPLLTVITSIGYDHVDRLGTGLNEIAKEKGGIIKAATPVVSGVSAGIGEDTLKEIAQKQNAPWRSIRQSGWKPLGWGLGGGSLLFPGWGEVRVGLLGAHQLRNAATALLALQVLRQLGYEISRDAVLEGMAEINWPGRMEIVTHRPFFLLDGGHNEEGLRVLAQALGHLKKELNTDKFTFVIGMLGNKEVELIKPLFPLAKRFVFTTADSGRMAFLEPAKLVSYAAAQGLAAVGITEAAAALEEALKSPPVCVCGSLYLVGNIKRYLRSQSLIT